MRKFIPKFIFKIYHFLLVLLGAVFYGFPSKKLIIIGVTGTSGKSTVVNLITEILAPQLRGKIASISSIRFKIGNKEWPNMLKMTMPGRFKIQKFLKQAKKAGCSHVVLEVTSEGIAQYRHKFIDFDGVVYTNLSKEHIEAHKGFENYKKTKAKLFKALNKSKKENKFIVINSDDKYGEYFAKLAGGVKKYGYSLKDSIKTPLLGEFNKYNSLAAFNAALALGVKKEKALKTIEGFKGIPGRMELVIEKPFKVCVDYAHTPDSLEKVYKTFQFFKTICVFGSCGGGRDKWKRPEIARIAEKYCNKIILTDEDPYDEDPEIILKQIEKGFSKKIKYEKILDRRKAINKALSLARKKDIVIITGKGSEPWMCVKGSKKIKWDDREIVKQEFKKIYG